MPIGFRRELSGVRHHELLIARERAILQDLELEISHQLGDTIRDVDNSYGLSQTNFNRRVASEKEVQAVDAAYKADRVTLDLLLDAQRRRAEAESAYYRSLIDYNKAIMNVHYRKGSLLDYNGVYLAEGPWPGKAYFDALREARKRDASMYLDYGFTRPNVISQGPYQQLTGEGCQTEGSVRRHAGNGSRPRTDERFGRVAADASTAAALGVAEAAGTVGQSGTSAPPAETVPRSPATNSRVHSMNVKRITRLLKLLELLQSGNGQNADGLAKARRDMEACGSRAYRLLLTRNTIATRSLVRTFCRRSISHRPKRSRWSHWPMSWVAAIDCRFTNRPRPALKLQGSLPVRLREELRVISGVIRIQPTPVSPLENKSQAQVTGLNEIMWWILGYGDQAEVLEPVELRQMVARRVRNMASMYNGDGTRARIIRKLQLRPCFFPSMASTESVRRRRWICSALGCANAAKTSLPAATRVARRWVSGFARFCCTATTRRRSAAAARCCYTWPLGHNWWMK